MSDYQMQKDFIVDENCIAITRTFVHFHRALEYLDSLVLTYEDVLREFGMRRVNNRWQVWAKVEDAQ